MTTETRTNMRWALNQAMAEEMERDSRVVLLGQDIGPAGGTFGVTRGLHERFGSRRVIDTPISEEGMANVAVGAAMCGLRPVLEIMFMDFAGLVLDAMANHAAKTRYLSGGSYTVPLVLRTLGGAGFRIGAHHGQSLETWFTSVPGLKVVQPATPADAKGLLKAAIRDEDPVVFIETKKLLSVRGNVPQDDSVVPIGVGVVARPGKDVTVVATGSMVHEALLSADAVAADGVSVEVIDPRTLRPLDQDLILDSVAKTGRLVIAHEAPGPFGFGAEIAALVAEHGIYSLDAPIRRVTGRSAPFPPGVAEDWLLPTSDHISEAIRSVAG